MAKKIEPEVIQTETAYEDKLEFDSPLMTYDGIWLGTTLWIPTTQDETVWAQS